MLIKKKKKGGGGRPKNCYEVESLSSLKPEYLLGADGWGRRLTGLRDWSSGGWGPSGNHIMTAEWMRVS